MSKHEYAKYEYVCTTGRHALATDKHPYTKCPVATCGQPLRRVGTGSRKAKQQEPQHLHQGPVERFLDPRPQDHEIQGGER